jgi:hypothetical protein
VGDALDGGLLISPHGRYARFDRWTPISSNSLAMRTFSRLAKDDARRLLTVPQGGIADDQLAPRQLSQDISLVPHLSVSHIHDLAPSAFVS